jgi:hypothetical protein
MTTKAANVLLPAIKLNTSLRHLDLSRNWLTDAVALAVIDLLTDNSDLLSLDLSGNNSLRIQSGVHYNYHERKYMPTQDRGIAEIVNAVLFDTTSVQAIAASNHTCAVKMSGVNRRNECFDGTIQKINALSVSEGKKIRFKVVLAIDEAKKCLYDPSSYDRVPLELMPRLFELVQQEIKYDKHNMELVSKGTKNSWNQSEWDREAHVRTYPNSSLNRLYEVIKAWNTPLLFARGAGELKAKNRTAATKTKVKPIPRKRRRFGDEDDDDDEPWVPKGARTKGKWEWNSETDKHEYIPPVVL